MSEKVLGIKRKEINKAIKDIKEAKKEWGTGLNIISSEKVLTELQKVFESFINEQVPVVEVEELKKFINVLEGVRHVDTATKWFQDLKEDLWKQAKAKVKK